MGQVGCARYECGWHGRDVGAVEEWGVDQRYRTCAQARLVGRSHRDPERVAGAAADHDGRGLELRLPKLRSGSFFPSLLERRRRIDQALFVVIMEACPHGVSTGKVDDLVKAVRVDTGMSKSEVSRICKDLDEEVAVFRDRSLAETTYPSAFLDTAYCKARVNHRVVSQTIVVAIGVTADGQRDVLAMDVGDS